MQLWMWLPEEQEGLLPSGKGHGGPEGAGKGKGSGTALASQIGLDHGEHGVTEGVGAILFK